MAAPKIGHHAPQIVVDCRVGVVVAVDATIRDDVEARVFLVQGDSGDGILDKPCDSWNPGGSRSPWK